MMVLRMVINVLQNFKMLSTENIHIKIRCKNFVSAEYVKIIIKKKNVC